MTNADFMLGTTPCYVSLLWHDIRVSSTAPYNFGWIECWRGENHTMWCYCFKYFLTYTHWGEDESQWGCQVSVAMPNWGTVHYLVALCPCVRWERTGTVLQPFSSATSSPSVPVGYLVDGNDSWPMRRTGFLRGGSGPGRRNYFTVNVALWEINTDHA